MKTRIAGLLLLLSSTVWADSFDSFFESSSRELAVPVEITQAVARVESGNSPWAINVAGQGQIYDSKAAALDAAGKAAAAGKSFDSGVMQVNNKWLERYGISLAAALDPEANIYLGSWILKQNMRQHGQTWNAVAAYHSPDAAKGQCYVEMVKAALARGSAKSGESAMRPVLKPVIRSGQTSQISASISRRAFVSRVKTGEASSPTPAVNAVAFVQRIHNAARP